MYNEIQLPQQNLVNNEHQKYAGVCTFVTKPLVKSKCEVRFIYLSAVSFSSSQQSTKHIDDFLFTAYKSSGSSKVKKTS